MAPFEKPRPRELSVPAANAPFDAYEALHGSYSSPEQCVGIDNALWVEIDGKGDCIRYYSSGLADGANSTLLVFFGGDVLLRTAKGIRFMSGSYSKSTPESLCLEMAMWSSEARRPAMFIARPGIFGSSGDHNRRRRIREIELMNAALEGIKRRYDVSTFILAGQSGGRQIVAALLNRLTDVSAAVIASGLVSVKRAVGYLKKRDDTPGRDQYNLDELYDPIDEIDQTSRNEIRHQESTFSPTPRMERCPSSRNCTM